MMVVVDEEGRSVIEKVMKESREDAISMFPAYSEVLEVKTGSGLLGTKNSFPSTLLGFIKLFDDAYRTIKSGINQRVEAEKQKPLPVYIRLKAEWEDSYPWIYIPKQMAYIARGINENEKFAIFRKFADKIFQDKDYTIRLKPQTEGIHTLDVLRIMTNIYLKNKEPYLCSEELEIEYGLY